MGDKVQELSNVNVVPDTICHNTFVILRPLAGVAVPTMSRHYSVKSMSDLFRISCGRD
jgi:hypothetical protein